MYIKQIVIQGFASYKDATIIEPFSPKHNCVVGRNGSGKSNFFKAIRFVLGDALSTSRNEERMQLLHEGSGLATANAFVEIIFDNSDMRFPIEKDEVILRRTIGQKKDEYMLDKKHATRADVLNLLESAGFSRSNPYYIVRQGKINDLAAMSDEDRLNLLKEVAGTRVYDERREESLRIMHETEGRRKKIDEMVEYLDERLKELDEEKDELKEYQVLDRERRSLEYTIYEKEMKEANLALESIDAERQEDSAQTAELHKQMLEVQERLRSAEKDLKSATKSQETQTRVKAAIEEELQEQVKITSKLECDVQDAEDRAIGGTASEETIMSDIENLRSTIAETEQHLADAVREYELRFAKESNVSEQVADAERRVQEMYSKTGRSKQFSTKSDRDKWLKREIKKFESDLDTYRSNVSQTKDDISRLSKEREDIRSQCHMKQVEVDKLKNNAAGIGTELNDLKRRRDELQNQRKEAWKANDAIQESLDLIKQEIVKNEDHLFLSVARDIRNGVQNVRRLATENHITGVYGPLIEQFEVDNTYVTAVEVTAGNSLFNIVVDNDTTATRLLELLNKEKYGGRVTFMPLNRLKDDTRSFPQSQDVIPMIQKLRFQPILRPAMAQVFGKTLISRNLDVGASFARDTGLNAITLDGDQVNKKGVYTGGYYEKRQSRIACYKEKIIHEENYRTQEIKFQSVKSEYDDLDQEVSRVLASIQKTDLQRQRNSATIKQLVFDLDQLSELQRSVATSFDTKKEKLTEMEMHIRKLESSLLSLRSEIGTELTDSLSLLEQQELDEVNRSKTGLKKQLADLTKLRAESEAKKASINELLQANLLKRLRDLEVRLQKIQVEDRERGGDLEALRHEYDVSRHVLSESESRLAASSKELIVCKRRVADLEALIEELRTLDNDSRRVVADESERLEKLLNRRRLLQSKKEECITKIRELGSLPADAFDKFGDQSLKQLMKMVHAVNNSLKKYSHVNKKALDQYVSFSDQRSSLLTRKTELDNGDRAIRDLIANLDARKDEAIERTFKGVAKHFNEVFKELVPHGSGSLVMLKGKSASDSNTDAAPSRIERFVGVSVRVTFTGDGKGSAQMMKQLSGGQKSLVAMALVFAIQRCDPAPFYLFDEVDANLDPAARTAVAGVIARQCQDNSTQFITTTFRPELVNVADKHYFVSFQNKVSRIQVVGCDAALAAIADDAPEDANRKDATEKGLEPAVAGLTLVNS